MIAVVLRAIRAIARQVSAMSNAVLGRITPQSKSILGLRSSSFEHRAVARTTTHKRFGEWMKETREALGMSQARFANLIGRSQSFVAKTELGERRMDIVEFIELAETLQTSPAKLFQRVLGRLQQR